MKKTVTWSTTFNHIHPKLGMYNSYDLFGKTDNKFNRLISSLNKFDEHIDTRSIHINKCESPITSRSLRMRARRGK